MTTAKKTKKSAPSPATEPAPRKPDATQVAFRWSNAFLARIDRHLERLQKLAPGLELTRADAVRSLLTEALDRAEAKR